MRHGLHVLGSSRELSLVSPIVLGGLEAGVENSSHTLTAPGIKFPFWTMACKAALSIPPQTPCGLFGLLASFHSPSSVHCDLMQWPSPTLGFSAARASQPIYDKKKERNGRRVGEGHEREEWS